MSDLHVDNFSEIPEDFTGIAVSSLFGQIRWYRNGKVHREDGPAVIGDNGVEFWSLNDEGIFFEEGIAVCYESIEYDK